MLPYPSDEIRQLIYSLRLFDDRQTFRRNFCQTYQLYRSGEADRV